MGKPTGSTVLTSIAAAASGDQQGVADCGASVPRFALRAIGIDHMRQENEDTHHADSHRNQLNHRTHRGHASPRSIKGALPFQYMAQKNVFGRPGRRRNLVSPCDRLAACFGSARLSRFRHRKCGIEPLPSLIIAAADQDIQNRRSSIGTRPQVWDFVPRWCNPLLEAVPFRAVAVGHCAAGLG